MCRGLVTIHSGFLCYNTEAHFVFTWSARSHLTPFWHPLTPLWSSPVMFPGFVFNNKKICSCNSKFQFRKKKISLDVILDIDVRCHGDLTGVWSILAPFYWMKKLHQFALVQNQFKSFLKIWLNLSQIYKRLFYFFIMEFMVFLRFKTM